MNGHIEANVYTLLDSVDLWLINTCGVEHRNTFVFEHDTLLYYI